jgi:hypothetical protein
LFLTNRQTIRRVTSPGSANGDGFQQNLGDVLGTGRELTERRASVVTLFRAVFSVVFREGTGELIKSLNDGWQLFGLDGASSVYGPGTCFANGFLAGRGRDKVPPPAVDGIVTSDDELGGLEPVDQCGDAAGRDGEPT